MILKHLALQHITFISFASFLGCWSSNNKVATAEAGKDALESKHVSKEKALSDLLFLHAVKTPLFSLVEHTTEETLRNALSPGRQVEKVNSARSGDEVILYIIDYSAAFQDSRICDAQNDQFLVPVKKRFYCDRVRHARFNCAVVGASTIVCDYRIFWRFARYAFVAALSTIKIAGSGQAAFDRHYLRRKFVTREMDLLGKGAALSKLAEIMDFLKQAPEANEPFARLWAGFIQYTVTHEAGHVYHRHAGTGYSPPCATAASRDIRLDSLDDAGDILCASENSIEVQADEFAITLLSKNVSADKFTGARASPELFIEEFERRTALAMSDLQLDPETWSYDSATQEERDLYTVIWLVRLSTGGHPQDLRRYVRLLTMLEERGVVLSGAKDTKVLADLYLVQLAAYCRQTGRLALRDNQ